MTGDMDIYLAAAAVLAVILVFILLRIVPASPHISIQKAD
jgi:hypothetical protein